MLYCACHATHTGVTLDLKEPSTWPIGNPPAAKYCGEDERLMVLASFDIDALEGDEELSRIARFAANLCRTPIAMVTLVEEERQRFLAKQGSDLTETPRSTSICAHTMLQPDLLEVCDAANDERFRDFTLVTGDSNLRFYAGVPLISTEGAPLGALCVIDDAVRDQPLDEVQREGLLVLAEAVKRRLQAHRHANSADFALKASAARVQFVLDSVPDIAWSAGPGATFDFFNARWREITGQPEPENVNDWRGAIHPDDYDATVSKFSEAVQKALPFEDEWRLRLADGSYRYVLSRAVPSNDNPQTARWFGTLTDIDDSRKVLQERELLAGELAHRIKNIFSVIIGLISMHAHGDESIKIFTQLLTDNIRALARAQEFALDLGDRSEDNLKSLLAVLMAPYGAAEKKAVTITGDDMHTSKRAATPLALAFHELATNSAKYGALSVNDGHVSIDVEMGADKVTIAWTESGGPEITAPDNSGFGSRLLKMTIERQLEGELSFDWKPGGLSAIITLPIARLADQVG